LIDDYTVLAIVHMYPLATREAVVCPAREEILVIPEVRWVWRAVTLGVPSIYITRVTEIM